MTTVSTHAKTDANGRLVLDLPTALLAREVEVVVILQPTDGPKKDPKKLRNLIGKLSWKGDPMEIQREMRNEWPE